MLKEILREIVNCKKDTILLFAIGLCMLFALKYHSPFELTLPDEIWLRAIASPQEYSGHVSFPPAFYKSTYVASHKILHRLETIMPFLSKDTILICIVIVAMVMSSYAIILLSGLFFRERILTFAMVFFWLFDINLANNGFFLSSYSDEVRHYIIGLPFLLFVTYFFLRRKYLYAFMLWLSLLTFSPSTFLIGIPFLIAFLLSLSMNKKHRIVLFIVMTSMAGLGFIYYSISRNVQPWWETIIYGRQQMSSIRGLDMSQIGLYFTIVCLMLWTILKKESSHWRQLVVLMSSTLAIIVGYVVVNDVFHCDILLQYQLLKIYWVFSLCSMLVLLRYTWNYLPKESIYLIPVLFMPLYKWGLSNAYYILFISNIVIMTTAMNKNKARDRLLVSISTALLLAIAIYAIVNHHYKDAGLSTGLLILLYANYRFIGLCTKYRKEILTSFLVVLMFLFVGEGFIRRQVVPPKRLIERKVLSQEFKEACSFIESQPHRGTVLVPYGFAALTTYYLFCSKPAIPVYYIDLLLSINAYSMQEIEEMLADFYGEEYLVKKSSSFKECEEHLTAHEKSAWNNLSIEKIMYLKKKYGLEFIIREIDLKLPLSICYQNEQYIVYDLRGHK